MEGAPALVSDAATAMSTAADAMKEASDTATGAAYLVGNMAMEGFVEGTGQFG